MPQTHEETASTTQQKTNTVGTRRRAPKRRKEAEPKWFLHMSPLSLVNTVISGYPPTRCHYVNKTNHKRKNQ